MSIKLFNKTPHIDSYNGASLHLSHRDIPELSDEDYDKQIQGLYILYILYIFLYNLYILFFHYRICTRRQKC